MDPLPFVFARKLRQTASLKTALAEKSTRLSSRAVLFQLFDPQVILPRTHFSRNAPAAPLESKLHDTYHERTALWKSETPPPGQHQLPRLTRDGVVGVVTRVAPVLPEDPCEDQHHRPQPPHFFELSELKSAVSMAGSHLSREKRVEEQVFLEGRQHYSPVEECAASPRVVRVLLDHPALPAFSLACLNFVLSNSCSCSLSYSLRNESSSWMMNSKDLDFKEDRTIHMLFHPMINFEDVEREARLRSNVKFKFFTRRENRQFLSNSYILPSYILVIIINVNSLVSRGTKMTVVSGWIWLFHFALIITEIIPTEDKQ